MTSENSIRQVKGRAVPLPGNDIDTDRIMPARYLKSVTFEKLGDVVFQDERFGLDGKKKPHPFNDPRHQGARVMVTGKNFGCGSSREHAPQGILRSGIKALVGESFAEIFAGNCVSIGLVAVTAAEADVKKLMDFADKNPGAEVIVDVETKTVVFGGRSVAVGVKESAHRAFLEGTWDSTATLLSAKEEVKKTVSKIPYLDWAP